MTQTIEELAEKRRKWVDAERDNGAEIKHLLTDQYPDNAHFIYELLQNAEDAHAEEVRFILHEDRIEFEHDGKRLFSIQDVDAITNIGRSTKRNDVTNIGKHGVGFKAVFAYTETPEIESGEFHFRIIDMRVPEIVAERDRLTERISANGQTRFILPFNSPKKLPRQARSEIEKLLMTLDATTLLFLTHIYKIEYFLSDSSIGYIERIGFGDNRFEIRMQQPNKLAPLLSRFLKFDKEVQVEDAEAEDEEHKVKTCRISVAFGMSPVEAKSDANKKKGGDSAKAIPQWELTPVESGSVCIYFPADKETSNLRFHLHAPFASTVARDSVRDCAGNNLLRDHLGDLLAESMSTIRDQGLLTVRALAVLPNDKDNLPKFYQPLITRLVREFQEQDLVPMKRGSHTTAVGIFRGPKALSDLIDDDDMVTLLGDDYFPPMWAANPSQRNQRDDNFLSMLEIEQWDIAELVKALDMLNKDALGHWMGGKDEKWHQDLYEMLIDFINTAPKYPYTAAEERKGTITGLGLVRCIDGIYRKGSDCFFPTDGIEHDDKFPRVAKGVYFADKEENKKAHEFLVMVGVCEVDEKAEIEYMLKERYSQNTVDKKQFRPELNDMERFIVFAEKHPGAIKLFQGHNIFKLESKEWGKPNQVYLDVPFMDTDLNIYYQILGSRSEQWALSEEYKTGKFNPQKIGEFAKRIGALTGIGIKHNDTYYSKDYTIDYLDDMLTSTNLNVSKLIWRTCIEHEGYYHKQSRKDGRCNFSLDGDSSIIAALKKSTWVPQKIDRTIEFVQPRDAVAEKLPEGFVFQTDWEWLKALWFGLGVKTRLEAKMRVKEHQSGEYERKEAAAKEFGFDSPEEAEEIARLKKENPEEFRQLKEEISARKERPTFPTRPVANPERRQERLNEQLSEVPDKEYEMRERSVRITNGAIDPNSWLRNLYTNETDQMVCQICKKEHFKKRNGEHYFEAVEMLSISYFSKEHEAQYLALCPLCAAMYKEFIKNDDNARAGLKDSILIADNSEVNIELGKIATSIRFVETHMHDLQIILSANMCYETK